MFTSGMVEAQTNHIKVADSNVKNFKAMLGFLYTGALRDPFDSDEVMILASKYNLHGMIKVCIAKMQWELCDHRGSSTAFPIVNELVELADKFAVAGVREALEKMMKGWCLTNEHVEPSCNTYHYRVPRRTEKDPDEELEMKTQHDKNLDFLVEALACAHVHGLPTLKSTCLGFLEKHHCNLDTKATLSLEKHPDLL